MKFFNSVLIILLSFTLVQSATICEIYSTGDKKSFDSVRQLNFISAFVNLAVLGDPALNVPGILASEGGLAPIFAGAGSTTNRGGVAVTVNFLDGGTNQMVLLEHLYQFFGSLIGCNAAGFPPYGGVASVFEVHRFMDIDKAENDFFIKQVGLAAGALGVSSADVTIITNLLDTTFNRRCSKPLTIEDGVPAFLIGTKPSVCVAETCPLDVDPDTTCSMPAEKELGFFGRIFARIRAFFSNLFG